MASHSQLRIGSGLDICFCGPHSPWQRGGNENTNGLLRQYFPKGTDLSRQRRRPRRGCRGTQRPPPQDTRLEDPTQSLEGDVEATRQVLDELDGDVVLVGHSYGGAVITEARTHQGVGAGVRGRARPGQRRVGHHPHRQPAAGRTRPAHPAAPRRLPVLGPRALPRVVRRRPAGRAGSFHGRPGPCDLPRAAVTAGIMRSNLPARRCGHLGRRRARVWRPRDRVSRGLGRSSGGREPFAVT